MNLFLKTYQKHQKNLINRLWKKCQHATYLSESFSKLKTFLSLKQHIHFTHCSTRKSESLILQINQNWS